MKKAILSFCTIILYFITSSTVTAQSKEIFTFDTKFYDGLDKWVVFPKSEKDTSYAIGFIYLDVAAGFTFNYEGNLEVKANKLVLHKSNVGGFVKHRLGHNTNNIAILNDNQIKSLALKKEPEWLAIYKSDPTKLHYQTKLGSFYNSVGASDKALVVLSKAYEKEKKDPYLLFELSYAYNALKQHDKAIYLY
ncbi:tetratricopeptide repeat protein [Flavobacterium enshiense]|uniref:tetratricopeptide repeat protein n=1 Tax=Flavobacterium enshiense TaxID=1341165 RepID=UPI00345DCA7A